MKKCSTLLCKREISHFLVNDLAQNNKVSKQLVDALQVKVSNKNDLKQLNNTIKMIKRLIPKMLYQQLLDEYDEIKADFNFLYSSKGKYIQQVNDWHQAFFDEFRAIKKFHNVSIGGHSSLTVVFVVGKLQKQQQYDELLTYLASKQPP